MEEEELARQLAFLGASDDPEVRAQAAQLLARISSNEKLLDIQSGRAATGAGAKALFERVKTFGQFLGGNLQQFTKEFTDSLEGSELLNTPAESGGLIGSELGQEIGGGIRSGAQALQEMFDPTGAAERLIAQQQEQTFQGPLQGLGPDLQQQAASAAANQTIAGFVPGQGLGPDLQQQAAAGAANQAGALQAINQQAQLVSALQAGQLQGLVQQDELQRTQELLRLMQVPQADPNILNTAANFAQAPAVSTQPNNLTTLLPQQQQIGSVDLASLLPAAQTNINQRQRTARTEESFINANVREQERALELARQQYIDQVALGIFRRPR